MQNLIELLKRIETNITIKNFGEKPIPQHLPDVEQASYLAGEILISPHGHMIWENIQMLRDAGYPVFPIERDGFGWLIGGVGTMKGVISFG